MSIIMLEIDTPACAIPNRSIDEIINIIHK
jgi:hypothetical protein